MLYGQYITVGWIVMCCRMHLQGSCSVTNATSMVCIAPTSLASATAPGIIVMNAAGPNLPIEDLQLTVAPNPEFSDSAVDQEYREDSGNTIRILVDCL